MKNARQVCGCRDVGELKFAGMNGSVVVGCQNTPAKGCRYCPQHKEIARQYIDDDIGNAKIPDKSGGDNCLLIVKVVNEKTTRQGRMFEVLWSDGRKSWVKEGRLPTKLEEVLKSGKDFHHSAVEIKELGQRRIELKLQFGKTNDDNNTYVHNSGFGIESVEDSLISESDGNKWKLLCGTEKGRHTCKNSRTAGILVMERPCGVVVNIKELFGSESKSQVYAHIHNLLENPAFNSTSTICYDDACHLKKFAQNPLRCDQTAVAARINGMEIICDRFHFKNHIDAWCRKNCNPLDSANLKLVNTEVCEQLFSWLSKFSAITKHMNRWRFLFLMVYVFDNHNEDVVCGVFH